jgi:biopolymer transport protein ExbD
MLYWNDRAFGDAELAAQLAEAAAKPVQPEVHLRADRDTRYQKLAEIMSAARLAGIQKLGFVTVPAEK